MANFNLTPYNLTGRIQAEQYFPEGTSLLPYAELQAGRTAYMKGQEQQTQLRNLGLARKYATDELLGLAEKSADPLEKARYKMMAYQAAIDPSKVSIPSTTGNIWQERVRIGAQINSIRNIKANKVQNNQPTVSEDIQLEELNRELTKDRPSWQQAMIRVQNRLSGGATPTAPTPTAPTPTVPTPTAGTAMTPEEAPVAEAPTTPWEGMNLGDYSTVLALARDPKLSSRELIRLRDEQANVVNTWGDPARANVDKAFTEQIQKAQAREAAPAAARTAREEKGAEIAADIQKTIASSTAVDKLFKLSKQIQTQLDLFNRGEYSTINFGVLKGALDDGKMTDKDVPLAMGLNVEQGLWQMARNKVGAGVDKLMDPENAAQALNNTIKYFNKMLEQMQNPKFTGAYKNEIQKAWDENNYSIAVYGMEPFSEVTLGTSTTTPEKKVIIEAGPNAWNAGRKVTEGVIYRVPRSMAVEAEKNGWIILGDDK